GSTIADDQLALTPAYRNHGINCHNTGLDRLADTSAFDYTRRDFLQRIKGIGFDFAFAIERFSERVNHATKQSFADWDGEQTTGGLGFIPLRDFSGITEQDCTDFRFLEVQRQAVDAPGKFNHFIQHHVAQSFDARDAVTGFPDNADVAFGSRRFQ